MLIILIFYYTKIDEKFEWIFAKTFMYAYQSIEGISELSYQGVNF